MPSGRRAQRRLVAQCFRLLRERRGAAARGPGPGCSAGWGLARQQQHDGPRRWQVQRSGLRGGRRGQGWRRSRCPCHMRRDSHSVPLRAGRRPGLGRGCCDRSRSRWGRRRGRRGNASGPARQPRPQAVASSPAQGRAAGRRSGPSCGDHGPRRRQSRGRQARLPEPRCCRRQQRGRGLGVWVGVWVVADRDGAAPPLHDPAACGCGRRLVRRVRAHAQLRPGRGQCVSGVGRCRRSPPTTSREEDALRLRPAGRAPLRGAAAVALACVESFPGTLSGACERVCKCTLRAVETGQYTGLRLEERRAGPSSLTLSAASQRRLQTPSSKQHTLRRESGLLQA